MTAHSAARLTHYLVAQREENFFLLFEGVSGKSMRRLVHPSNANRLQTHLPALLCGSWHFFLSGCLIFMVAAMFDLGLRLVCEWRFINVRWVSVLQRSPTHWAVLESISSGCVKAIRTTKVGWRDMRRQREKRFINKKRPLCCCRGGTASSRVRNWVVVLKGRTSLRLKPHCFSSTRWYFLSVGPLRASGWSTGGGNASA